MNDLYQSLKSEFQDPDYRYAYAESWLNTKLASQVKTLREQRGETQVEIAEKIGIKQPGYRRFEDVNHSVWKTDSLWAIARALGVRLNISFETFGKLIEEKKRFTKENLRPPNFENDPAFKEAAIESEPVKIDTSSTGGPEYFEIHSFEDEADKTEKMIPYPDRETERLIAENERLRKDLAFYRERERTDKCHRCGHLMSSP